MKQAQAYQKLRSLAKQSLDSIRQNIIVKERNYYVAFDRFKIVKTADGFSVYRYGTFEHEFVNSQNATSFCILEKHGRQDYSQNLLHLDKKLQHKMFDFEVAKHTISKSKDKDRITTAAIRAQESILESKNLKEQINHIVNLAKYFQEKELTNETN